MSDIKIEYRFIQERTPQQYEHTVENLLNEGFSLRGQSFRFSEFICGEFVKYPEGYLASTPLGYGRPAIITPGQSFKLPEQINALSSLRPEGQEIMSRLIKCYNNPKFREMLEEMAKDFLEDEENTALTDLELSRLFGEDLPMGRIGKSPKENPDE